MKKISIITLAMLLFGMLCHAQYTDQQLFNAYMSGNLDLWGKYIASTDWSKSNHVERMRLINYEYGYIPVLIDQKDKRAPQMLQNYQSHLVEEKDKMPLARYYTYLSAANAYVYKLDKSKLFTSGLQSFKLARKAVETDPTDPIPMTLEGNVEFYAPKAFGGSKTKALELFIGAEKAMQADKATYGYWWNYPAIQLCIVQCYEKMGDTDKALAKAKTLLVEHPNFKYLKDVYLPELQKKVQKK